jgi:6-phospho-beta-glucosidase
MAHARSVLALKELWPDAKVGSSFAYGPSYAVTNKPEDAMAKADYDDLQNYYWMDVYAYGRYPRAARAYQESRGIAPHLEDGDEAILKEAAAKVDFMGVNYYQTTSVEYNPIDGVDGMGKMNTTGEKGTSQVSGVAGLYRNPKNQYLPTTDWDWTIDPMGLRYCCREITSRYDLPILISENGLGAFDKVEDGKIHDLRFTGGCNGNLKAIGKLLEGADARETADTLRGNTCGPRPTSCTDQLAKAIDKALA